MLLPVIIIAAVAAAVFVGAALLVGLSELIADEARGWLELAPSGILRLAATRLPADQRERIYREEWLPELLCEMRKGEGRPITRLYFGTRYAISLARSAGKVGRELEGVRNNEPEVHQVQLSDMGATTEDLDVYRDEYQDTYGGAPVGACLSPTRASRSPRLAWL